MSIALLLCLIVLWLRLGAVAPKVMHPRQQPDIGTNTSVRRLVDLATSRNGRGHGRMRSTEPAGGSYDKLAFQNP